MRPVNQCNPLSLNLDGIYLRPLDTLPHRKESEKQVFWEKKSTEKFQKSNLRQILFMKGSINPKFSKFFTR